MKKSSAPSEQQDELFSPLELELNLADTHMASTKTAPSKTAAPEKNDDEMLVENNEATRPVKSGTRATKKRLILPLQAKGTIGKSTVLTLLGEYLTSIGEIWRGFDLDERNQNFSRAFGETMVEKEGRRVPLVRHMPLNEKEHRDNFSRILAEGTTDPVTLIDPQAFTDHYIRDVLDSTNFFASNPDIAVTLLLFPFQEDTVMREIEQAIDYAKGRADFVIVYNKTKDTSIRSQFQLFLDSPLEKEVYLDRGKTRDGIQLDNRVYIDYLWEQVRLKHRQVCASQDRGVRYGEFYQNDKLAQEEGITQVQRGNMENWVKRAFWEFDINADLLTTVSVPPPRKLPEREIPGALIRMEEMSAKKKQRSLAGKLNFEQNAPL